MDSNMKYLAEKLIILVICVLSLYDMEITYRILAGGLLALSAACFCQALEKRKVPRLTSELLYGAAALVFPEMSFCGYNLRCRKRTFPLWLLSPYSICRLYFVCISGVLRCFFGTPAGKAD